MSLSQILARPQPPLAQTPTPMAQALTPQPLHLANLTPPLLCLLEGTMGERSAQGEALELPTP